MKESASQIFSRVGIEVEWIPCAPGPRDSAVCPNDSDSPSRTIIFVRLLDAPIPPKQGGDQIHRALLGRANHDTASVDVFYSTVCAIEQRDPRTATKGQILGHVVSHEIGHLLLATDTHPLVGIMKENYDTDDLFAMANGSLWFAPGESRVIRRRILSASAPSGRSYSLPRIAQAAK